MVQSKTVLQFIERIESISFIPEEFGILIFAESENIDEDDSKIQIDIDLDKIQIEELIEFLQKYLKKIM